MAKAGQGILPGLDRATGHGGLFEHPDTPALRRKVQRCGQGVVARPDQDCVEIFGHLVPESFPDILSQRYLQMHLNLSSMILIRTDKVAA